MASFESEARKKTTVPASAWLRQVIVTPPVDTMMPKLGHFVNGAAILKLNLFILHGRLNLQANFSYSFWVQIVYCEMQTT